MSYLEVDRVTKRFGALVALNNVTLTVKEGEIVGLIGPNGAGKTTLFNVVTGFLKPDSGRIRLFGGDVTGRPPHEVAKRGVARSFQIVKPFYGMTVFETALVGAYLRARNNREAEERATEALKLIGIYDLREKYVKDLNTQQMKFVELARCLATSPKLLLLDEVVSGLTPAEVDQMIDLIRRLNEERGITIFLVEHVMRFVMKVSDRVIVLHHGEVISEGTPEEVSNDERVIEAYLGRRGTVIRG